jgi:hypothetical protein
VRPASYRLLEVAIVAAVAIGLWWLLRPAHKAVQGDVLLGDPTVVASSPAAQAGSSDYYTSSTPGDFQ